MTTKLLTAALGVFVLAGCAHHGHFRLPDPTRPTIVFSPGGQQLVVNQEPIIIVLKDNAPNLITWRLPPESGLSFNAQNGIRILGRTKDDKYEPIRLDPSDNSAFVCALGEGDPRTTLRAGKNDQAAAVAGGPQAFTCSLDARLRNRGLYSYEINASGPQGTFRLDPSIMPK